MGGNLYSLEGIQKMRIKGVNRNFTTQSPQYKEKSFKDAKVAAESSLVENSTNYEFAESNGKSREDCENAGILPTARQASRYRRGMGLAFGRRTYSL